MFSVIRNLPFFMSQLCFSLCWLYSQAVSPFWWTKMTPSQQLQLTCLATPQKKSASFVVALDWVTCPSLNQSVTVVAGGIP